MTTGGHPPPISAEVFVNVQRRGLSAEMIMKTNQTVPKNGRAVSMRNDRTGAAWLVSFDYRDGTYWHEPQGNLRNIRRPYASLSVEPNLVPAGTH